MEVKNLTLVITDPCYLREAKPLMEDSTIYGDWSCMVYPGKLEESTLPDKWRKHYTEFHNRKRKILPNEKELFIEEWRKLKEEWLKNNTLGEFCADSGRVAVFDYDKLPEKYKFWIEIHPWCATIIEDFTGNIKFYDSDRCTRHVIGEGDKPFFSVQSGF